MKMHLPLGLRRALFNTFIAIGAVAVAAAPTQAGIQMRDVIDGHCNTKSSDGNGNYTNGSSKHTESSLDGYALNFRGNTIFSYTYDYWNGTGWTNPYAALTIDAGITQRGTVYMVEGPVTINAASILIHDYAVFTGGFKANCQVTLGTDGEYAIWNGSSSTAIGNSDQFTLAGATSLTANKAEITLEDDSLSTLTVNSLATVNTSEALTLTSLTMSGGTLNANAGITATTDGTMSDGTITTTNSTLNLSGVAVSGGAITSNGTGAITTGAVSGGAITSNGTGAITASGNVTGGTFSGQSITLGSGAVTVKDTNTPLVISGGTLTLNGVTPLTNAGSSVDVHTLNVNAYTQLTNTVEISSDTNIEENATLTLSGVQAGNLGVVGNNGAASTGGLTLTSNTTAEATSVQVGTLTVGEGSALTASSITSTGVKGVVAGSITASNITLAGTVKGAANLEATQKLDLTSATVSTTEGSVLHGNEIALNATTGSSVTNGKVHADTSLDVGAGLTLNGGTNHELGKVTGTELNLRGNAGADSASVNVGVLRVDNGSTLNSSGDITASAKANLNGTVSTSGTLSVAEGSAEKGTLTAETFTNTGTFTIFAGKVDFDETVVGTGTTLTVREESGNRIDSASDLGEVTVAGPNTKLEIEMRDTGINGDISVSDGGKLTINGTYGVTGHELTRVTHTGDIEIDGTIVSKGATHASATLTNTLLKGDVTVQNAGVLTLSDSKVNGDVTLEGTGDTLNMEDSAITGTLTAGNGSTVSVTGANTAGNIRLETGADLVYTDAGATLNSNVTVNGTGSSATIGQTGMTGNLTVEDGGTGTIVAGATLTGKVELHEGQVVIGDDAHVTGNIELTDADTNHGDRTLTIEGDFTMTKDTDLYINTHDEHEAVNTVVVKEETKTFTVEDLTGAGDFNLTGAGNVVFQGDESTHTGDIVSTLTGDITASEKNSLGTEGALVINRDDKLKGPAGTLYIYGDQEKDITINRTGVTLSTNDGTEVKDVTLNGVVSGNALVLDDATVTLANAADDLKSVTVNANSTLRTTNGGTYDNVTNLGSTTMDKATVGTLRNEGVIDIDDSTVGTLVNATASTTPSTVDGGTLGGVVNEDGTLTITGTAMLAGANITNSDDLTLDGIENANDEYNDPTVAGTLTNNTDATLTVSGSKVDFTTANLGGTVNVTGSQLATTGTMTVSGTTTMGGEDSSLNSGEEGTNITGSVFGTGDITSEGTVSVTGGITGGNIGGSDRDDALEGDIEAAAVEVSNGFVNLQGTVTTGEMDVTEGSTVAITGNGLSEDGVGSSLGEVTVTGSSLTLTNDEFSGNIAANAATETKEDEEGKTPSVVEIRDAEYTGNVVATGSNVRVYGTEMEGDITGTDSNVLLSESTLRGVLTVNSDTPDGVGLEKSAIIGKVDIVGNVELNGKNDLHATADSVIDGAIGSTTEDGSLHKYGENLTLTGDDADGTTATDYTVYVHEGSLTLDNTARKGTVEADAGTTIKVQGGESTVGDLVVYGNGNAAHSPAVSNQATIVEIGVAGQDKLVSATGAQLSAYDATGTRGAQIVIDGWSVEDTFTGYTDGQRLMVGEGITGFDKEIVHDRVTQNVNLVEEVGEDGVTTNSYAAISINHKGATKNKYQQGVSDAIVSAEGVAAEGSRLDEMIHALSHTANEQGAKDALDCIGGAGIATTMAAQMSANRDHMRTLRHSIGQPEPLPYNSIVGTAIRRTAGTARPHEQKLQFPTRLWAEATGSSADLGSDSLGGVGYTRNDWGVLVGSDVTLSNTALVGLAAGYSRSHVNALNHTISGDQYFVDLFTRVNTCCTTHTATIGVGFFDWDLDRNVHVRTEKLYEDFVGQGKGQTKGMAFNFSYEVAYNIRINEKHTLAPVFQVESSLNHINGYSEKAGTLGNAGLNVEFDNTFVTTLGLGLHYSYEFDGFNTAENKGSIGARAMLIGDVGDAYGTMHGSFIGGGQQFEAESTRISRQGILLGVDALVPVSKQWAIFGSADFEIRDDYRDISGGIGARYTF